MTGSKHYLNVPYAEKDQAKALGARWDPQRKSWYVPEGKAIEPFARWTPESPANGAVAMKATPTIPLTTKLTRGKSATTVAITQPTDPQFVPYSGDEPPWD